MRFGCSLTSWVRTSRLVAPCPRHLRQEGLPRAPFVPAAQSRMPCAVRSWESVSGTASELDSTRLRCGGGQPPQRAKGRDARGRVMCSAAKHGSACARPGPRVNRLLADAEAACGDGAPPDGARGRLERQRSERQAQASPADGAGGLRAHSAPPLPLPIEAAALNGTAESPGSSRREPRGSGTLEPSMEGDAPV